MVRPWGPGTAPPGGGGRSSGGGTSHSCQGGLPSGALPLSAARPSGGQRGLVARVSQARVLWAWGPSTNPSSVRFSEPALRAVGLAGGRPRGGGASRRREGRLRLGARPLPAARP